MTPYRYLPLRTESDEIRVVHLYPGNLDDPLTLRMAHAALPAPPALPAEKSKFSRTEIEAFSNMVSFPWEVEETERGDLLLFHVVTGETHAFEPPERAGTPLAEADGLRFEALSYTWGVGEVSEFARVEANDQEADSVQWETLGLRPNLAAALRHLRRPDEIRVLWVDAMCINQEDMDERSEQVKRMASIYSLAHKIVAWLGEEADGSAYAINALQHVGRQLESTKSGRVIAAPNASEPRLWRNDHAVAFEPQAWDALITFVDRPWFYRIWCWQEIQLGGRQALVVCGKDTIPWGDFWLAILCLHNKDRLPSIWFRERCRHIVFLKYSAPSMSSILDISRSKGCADPRDKIYGLLGITPESFAAGISVQYSRSVQDVYKEAFLRHLGTTQRLELLKHCDLANRQTGGPSWVPDWSVTEFAAPILSEQLSSGISRAWYTYVEPDVLEVVGKRYSNITFVSEVASKISEHTLLAVKDWFQYLPQDDRYVTGESMEAAFVLSLCMNRTREKHPYSHFMSTPEYVDMLRQILQLTEADADSPLYSQRETANMIQKIRGRRFFTTDDGLIGTAPAGAQVGDSICLILGTYAPMVLRHTSTGSWQVVGECYVHGLSDTVGILGPIPHPWKTITKGDSLGRPTLRFVNCDTGEETLEDARLGPLPGEWVRASGERSAGDPEIFQKFCNTRSGELVN